MLLFLTFTLLFNATFSRWCPSCTNGSECCKQPQGVTSCPSGWVKAPSNECYGHSNENWIMWTVYDVYGCWLNMCYGNGGCGWELLCVPVPPTSSPTSMPTDAPTSSPTQALCADDLECSTEEDYYCSSNGICIQYDKHYCINHVCSVGDGDCDSDSECEGDLVCGTNNFLEYHPNFTTGTNLHYRDVCILPPTASPTSTPTTEPTSAPTAAPSGMPTKEPSFSPTQTPTTVPTSSPTVEPSGMPTKEPSFSPNQTPTSDPTFLPTNMPTPEPTSCSVSTQDCGDGFFCDHAYDDVGNCHDCGDVDCKNASEDQWPCCENHVVATCNPTICFDALTCTDGTCCDENDWDCCGDERLYCPSGFIMCTNKQCATSDEHCLEQGEFVMYTSELCSSTIETTSATSSTLIEANPEMEQSSVESTTILSSSTAIENSSEAQGGSVESTTSPSSTTIENNPEAQGVPNDNSCVFALDGECDVYGAMAFCAPGTDCSDCGDCPGNVSVGTSSSSWAWSLTTIVVGIMYLF